LLLVIGIVLITEWSLHTHPEHWHHLQSVFLCFAGAQIELTWVQNGQSDLKKVQYTKKNILAA
jgi:hypothetical protein